MKSSILCWLATVVFMTSNVVDIVLIVVRKDNETNDRDVYLELLPEVIQQSWTERFDEKGLFYAAIYLNCAFWIIFTLPVIEMAWILSRSGTQALGWNAGIVVFALGGAWTEWFSNMFWAGMSISSLNLAENFNLDEWLRPDLAASLGVSGDDGLGWRDLELNSIVTSGMVWFVGIFEWLCLAGIFVFAFFSVLKWRTQDQSTFGARWNALGLFIGLLALVEFAVEIALFEGFTLAAPIFLLYTALIRLILIPAWIISLGYQLPRATARHFESHDEDYFVNGDLALSEGPPNPPPTFTIDESDTYGVEPKEQQQNQSPAKSPPPSAFKGPSSPPAEAFGVAPPMLEAPPSPTQEP